MSYLARILDADLDEMLEGLPAISIVGPRAVGKTETARRHAKTRVDLTDPDTLQMITADPSGVTTMEGPVLIDEWQLFPYIWDVVRRAVDDHAGGPYILTGSATPTIRPSHSGAGRIVPTRLRPMSLAERALVAPSVSLAALLKQEETPIQGTSPLGLQDYAEEIVVSGFPGMRSLPARSRGQALDGYLDLIVQRDFPELGHAVRHPSTLRAWMTAYAAATSTTASYTAILDAATAGEPEKPTRATTLSYRETLERMWMLDELPAWLGAGSTLKALGRTPKHHLADPAFAARLLRVNAESLLNAINPASTGFLRDTTLIGALFESLATLCVRVYTQETRGYVSHLRTHKGDHEIDLIVERGDGKVLAIEVKLNKTPDDKDVRHLHWLKANIGDQLVDFMVITTGPYAYRRQDGIAVVPLALLGP